ncbi:hypothetical protein SDC9_155592 [bioreactor metagenome]|uniref:Uncharacterized protein n=1 Tax=bioreactor metagenome TaxID=1076179 RepID=A0A645F3A6_9ZZZZ
MPVAVVVFLEAVDIEQQHRQGLAIASGVGPFELHDRIEHAPVGHPCQAILVRQRFEFAL